MSDFLIYSRPTFSRNPMGYYNWWPLLNFIVLPFRRSRGPGASKPEETGLSSVLQNMNESKYVTIVTIFLKDWTIRVIGSIFSLTSLGYLIPNSSLMLLCSWCSLSGVVCSALFPASRAPSSRFEILTTLDCTSGRLMMLFFPIKWPKKRGKVNILALKGN